MSDPVIKPNYAISAPLTEGRFYNSKGDYWSVARLVEVSKNLPIFDFPLAAFDQSELAWKIRNVDEFMLHYTRVQEANLEHPILFDWLGRLCDGNHRVIKAILLGKKTLPARRIIEPLTPCGSPL